MAASNALEPLIELLFSEVHVEWNREVKDIDLKELKKEDVVVIKPGEKIPAHAVVLDGVSFVNDSMLTGESAPGKKEKKDKLIAGFLNGDGLITALVTGAGEDSCFNKVINLVQSAQSVKSNIQNFADNIVKWISNVSILVGIATFVYWFGAENNLATALERLVMVASCTHARGVAISSVVSISTTRAAVSVLLIRTPWVPY